MYETPMIVFEGQLEVHAGSPIDPQIELPGLG